MKVYAVQAAQGDYDEKSWWAVAVWTSQALAVKHAERLNWCARQLREALQADPMPQEDHEKLYDAWRARRDRLLKKWRRLSGDQNLEEYHQPTYSVVPLKMHSRWSAA